MRLSRLSVSAMLLGVIACSTVQTVRDPAAFMATRPDFIVVVWDDNSEVPIAQPQLRGDTLFGTWQGLNEPVVAPLNRLKRIDAIQRDAKRTTMLIVGLAAATAVTTYGFVRAVQDHGIICDFFRPEDRQCYISSGDPDDPE